VRLLADPDPNATFGDFVMKPRNKKEVKQAHEDRKAESKRRNVQVRRVLGYEAREEESKRRRDQLTGK